MWWITGRFHSGPKRFCWIGLNRSSPLFSSVVWVAQIKKQSLRNFGAETLKIWLEKMWKVVEKPAAMITGPTVCLLEFPVLFILCSWYNLIWDLEFKFLLCQLFPIFSFGFHFLFSFDGFLSLLGLALFDCCHPCLVTLLCLSLASLFLFVTG